MLTFPRAFLQPYITRLRVPKVIFGDLRRRFGPDQLRA
jgi:hypothetical protein